MDAKPRLTPTLLITLRLMRYFPFGGVPNDWKPQSRAKLESMGLVVMKAANGHERYFLTDVGRCLITKYESLNVLGENAFQDHEA